MTDSTTTIVNDELFAQPTEAMLASLRYAALLPSETRPVTWQEDQQALQPAAGAAFATLSPRVPFSARGSLYSQDIDFFSTGTSPSVTLSAEPDSPFRTGIVYHNFTDLEGSSKCVAWIKVGVDLGNSLRISGTGNPTELIVNGSAAAGPLNIPFAFTATLDGMAYLHMLPSPGKVAAWLSTSVYVL